MSINKSEEINNYYKAIEPFVDSFIYKHKVKPSNLKNYLKNGSKGFERIINISGLKEKNENGLISRVLSDIIDDRVSMELDGVLTFENFKFFESDEFKIMSLKQCLYKGIQKADIKMEKVLADYYDTNLGEIDVVDADKHLFKVSNVGTSFSGTSLDDNVVIYSKEDLDIIKANMIEHLYEDLSKQKVSLSSNISIPLSDLIKKESFDDKMESMFSEEFLLKIISDCLEVSDGTDKPFDKKDDYYIWAYLKKYNESWFSRLISNKNTKEPIKEPIKDPKFSEDEISDIKDMFLDICDKYYLEEDIDGKILDYITIGATTRKAGNVKFFIENNSGNRLLTFTIASNSKFVTDELLVDLSEFKIRLANYGLSCGENDILYKPWVKYISFYIQKSM